MVVRTEYRGQRYSMGSLDPLPAGFKIRFGSLNFQATGNGYLMRITNRDELRAQRPTGPGPVPAAPAADAPVPTQADAAGSPTPQRCQRSGQRSQQARTERRLAARIATQRGAITGMTATTPTGERAVSGSWIPLGLRGAAMVHASSANADVAAREDRPGLHSPVAGNLAATIDDESYHGSTSAGNWRDKYITWMDRGELPSDRSEATRIARMAKSFTLIDDKLYKRAASGVLQRCLPIPQGRELLRDIHAGVCGHHAAPRTLMGNAFRQDFCWPTVVVDASEIVRTCEGCQFYTRKFNLPAHVLQTIPVTWPFAVWGLDIVGPLRKALGGYTHLLVAIDKFSKWVEVRRITNLRAEQAVTFFTDIIYRFGVPNSIIADNGSRFTGRKFLEFHDKFHIRVDWATVAHPQTNGQVERANGMILQDLKPRIFDRLNKSGRKWLHELPAVVSSLRTLFFLVYSAEAILPTDLEYESSRVQGYDEGANKRAREDSLDQLDEARTVALMHSARYQQGLRRYQARKVRRRDFNEGDLVLRMRQDNRDRHKLSPPWEGPYVVVKVLKPGTYKLANEDGEELTNAWNIQQLRRFYP
jgi:transposase InsO family protein